MIICCDNKNMMLSVGAVRPTAFSALEKMQFNEHDVFHVTIRSGCRCCCC
jgi:hypothetical protein